MTVSRSRVVAAPPEVVWPVLADPYRLPAWWPRTERVEGVRADGWTSVLRSERGRAVRADFLVLASEAPRRRAWQQVLRNTPFERVLRDASTEARLAPAGAGTEVVLTGRQRTRGLARFGGLLLRRALRRQLDAALEGLAEVVE